MRRHRQLLTFWSANRALATVLRTFCQQISPIEARNRGNRYPTSATPEATLKTQGFAPESAFTREFARFRTVTLPNYLGGWHDDAVDMTVWMLTMTIVRNSEVFKLNFLWYPLIIYCSYFYWPFHTMTPYWSILLNSNPIPLCNGETPTNAHNREKHQREPDFAPCSMTRVSHEEGHQGIIHNSDSTFDSCWSKDSSLKYMYIYNIN